MLLLPTARSEVSSKASTNLGVRTSVTYPEGHQGLGRPVDALPLRPVRGPDDSGAQTTKGACSWDQIQAGNGGCWAALGGFSQWLQIGSFGSLPMIVD